MHRIKNILGKTVLLLCGIFFFFITDIDVCAVETEEEKGNYSVIIEDDAELLLPEEEIMLKSVMQDITAYGNVAFKSISENDYSTESYIRNYYEKRFGDSSGTVFAIDMDNRYIWIYSHGDIYDVITDENAEIITDNVYIYASGQEYFICAAEAYSQIFTLLNGERIARPMKHISNAIFAIVLALIINYFVVKAMSGTTKPEKKQLLNATRHKYEFTNAEVKLINTTKVYSPRSSGSSSSGSRSSGGSRRSGGGGGRSRGGGGGHRF